MANSLEIRCTACKHVALARMEPVYEDFKKVAENFVCSACGHRYPSRDKTPFLDASGRPQVFSAADKPAEVKVFHSDERRRSCAWCRHFIVNPFYQRCGLNNRMVEATDICARFLAKADQPAETGKTAAQTAASSRFDALFHPEPPAAPAAHKPAPRPQPPPDPSPEAEAKKTVAKSAKKTTPKPAKKAATKPRKKSE